MSIAFRLRASNSRALRVIPQLLGIALLAAACASQPPAAAPAKAEKPDPQKLFAPADGKVILSPKGDWFVDEEGRQYYLVEVERKPSYTVLPGNRVMLPPGAAYGFVEERENSLILRIDRPASPVANEPRPAAPPATSPLADLAALKTGSSDRLRLVPFDRGLPRGGQWRQGFDLVDLDGDGNLDIVHAPPRKGDGKPKIFLGDGTGGWRLWQEARFEGQSLDYGDIAVADFDGDGALDLAVAVHLRGLQVLRGDGRGNFRQWGEGLPYWAPEMGGEVPEFSSRTVEAVDWNRDGRPDLLTLGEGPRIVRQPAIRHPGFRDGTRGPILFLNRGGGTWDRYDQGTGRDRLFGDGLAVGDFNGDGFADFAVASRVKGATNILQLGKADGSWEDVSLGQLARPGIYGAVHAADLDGDGRDELLLGYVAGGAGKDSWSGIDLIEHEAGSWRRTPLAAQNAPVGGVTALATGDLDRDGLQDIVALTGSGERWVLLGTAKGTFVREASAEIAPSEPQCQGYEVGVASLGGGERAVLVMGFAGEPGSEQIFDVEVERRCPSQGSLEAWTPTTK